MGLQTAKNNNPNQNFKIKKLFDLQHELETSFEVYGHRGARGIMPKNTIPAFLKAIELGAHGIELDLVVTKDQQLVVSHEPWFSSLISKCPNGNSISIFDEKRLNIFEMDYTEVAQYDCGSKRNPHFPKQKLMACTKPLLVDVLDAVEFQLLEENLPNLKYKIEIKSKAEWDGIYHPNPSAYAKLVVDAVVKAKLQKRVTIQSFDHRILKEIRILDKDIRLAVIVENNLGVDRNLSFLGFTPDSYVPHYNLIDADDVKKLHEEGVEVYPWTVNTTGVLNKMKNLGVDGIISDFPDVALAHLDLG